MLNAEGLGLGGLVRWANKLLRDAYDYDRQLDNFLSVSGSLLSGMAVANEQSMKRIYRDILLASKRHTFLDIMLDIASARTIGQKYADRCRRVLAAMCEGLAVAKAGHKVKLLPRKDQKRMEEVQAAVLEGR